MTIKMILISEDNAAELRKIVADDPKSLGFFDDLVADLPLYLACGMGPYYLVKDLKVNGGFVYPFGAITPDYILDHPENNFEIVSNF